jgi:hypothetical protein
MATLVIIYLTVLAVLGGTYSLVRWIQHRCEHRDHHR